MIATDELVKRVRGLLNEAEEDKRLSFLTEDTRSIDEHILRLLPQAVALVQKSKAKGLVNCKSVAPTAATAADNGYGACVLVLPDDYAELVSLQLEEWQRPCCRLFPPHSGEAMAQDSIYTRAGVCRPVAVEGADEDGKRVALLYPAGSGKLRHFIYEAVFDAGKGLEGCDTVLADAVAYYCAALLYTVFERQDLAGGFLSLATALCNGKDSERR
ncbi:MAG: hypothetical protein IKJ95_00025 [Bacteroidaceae bacterium]|nr:hypothetical protein [Bacteroidaceae bacterium]